MINIHIKNYEANSSIKNIIGSVIVGLLVAGLIICAILMLLTYIANSYNLTTYATELVLFVVVISLLKYLLELSLTNSEPEEFLQLEKKTRYGVDILSAELSNSYTFIDVAENETLIVAPIGENPRNWDLETTLSESNNRVEFIVDKNAESPTDNIYKPDEKYSVKKASFSESNGIVVYDNNYEEIDRIEK